MPSPVNMRIKYVVNILVGACIVNGGVLGSGEQKQSARVIGGKEAEPHSYPSMLWGEPGESEDPIGGALLHPQWVLTSAYNAFGEPGVNWYGGRHNVHNHTEEDVTQKLGHEWPKYPHPGFSMTDPGYKDDIALFRLKERFELNDIVQIAAVASENSPLPENATIVGWGIKNLTTHFDSDVLLQADAPIVSNSVCEELWKAAGHPENVFEDAICAGEFNGTNACFVELGSPLYAKVEGGKRNVVIGILSVPGCLPTTTVDPWKSIMSVYTRVSKYIGWIESITGLKFEPHGNSGYGYFKELSSGGKSASGNIQGQTATVLKLASELAHSLCSQMESYSGSKNLLPPVKTRPAAPSAINCGRFPMQKCDASSCKPFHFLKC